MRALLNTVGEASMREPKRYRIIEKNRLEAMNSREPIKEINK